jgi:hypothetical protein
MRFLKAINDTILAPIRCQTTSLQGGDEQGPVHELGNIQLRVESLKINLPVSDLAAKNGHLGNQPIIHRN